MAGVLMNMSRQQKNNGPPELATCGKDGCVRVWDVRQHDAPVAAFVPQKSDKVTHQMKALWTAVYMSTTKMCMMSLLACLFESCHIAF
jgi:hypothetical protein